MTTTTIILIVLFALVILYLAVKSARRKTDKTNQKENGASLDGKETERSISAADRSASSKDEIPGEVLTAIFMALHEEQEVVHDYENTVLTMDRVVRNYSPWNSKFYGLREVPRR